MANIPGLSGYQQPGAFARDRVISKGVSTPGGQRIACIMGEGLREEVLVESAIGNGEDGSDSCSPTGSASGRYFSLSNAPVVSGRTELYLNGSILFGKEGVISATTSLDSEFDFRLDPETGCIELQGASIADQDGKKYSASSINVGNGVIVDGTCGTYDLISVIDDNATEETWTVRCVGVIRDSNGDPVPGKATFTVTGSVSGQLRDAYGQPILFHDSYFTSTTGAVSANEDACADGFVVATSDDFGVGDAAAVSGDASPLTTTSFTFSGDLVSQGQAQIGDELCVDGYVGIEIEDIEYSSGTDLTTLTLATDSLDASIVDTDWEIRATNLFIDDHSIAHNGLTGVPATAGNFTSADVGKVVMICSGDSTGTYEITEVTSSRRVRVQSLDDSSVAFPTMADDDADGLAETGLTFHILETNGVLLFGINDGTVPFAVGDKFFISVNSKALKEGDNLEAKYIYELDLEDPELFESANELSKKHGVPSLTNTLSLGAQMAFENGAPQVYAIQSKPALSRRISSIMIEEEDSNGDGGFSACGGSAADCEADDLLFPIPRPVIGLLDGRPDTNTQVNIFVIRNDVETQIFPNKVGFYNSQFESATGQTSFITSSNYSYSYTIINTGTKVIGQGYNAALDAAAGTFSTLEVDFDAADVGTIIVLQKIEDTGGLVYTTADDISTELYGSTAPGIELVITAIVDDNTVTVVANDGSSTALTSGAVDVQFYIKDLSDTTNEAAALLLHKDLVDSGTLQEGDGIRISYIDEKDADFYDVNWFNSFEAMEPISCQMVVPLPTQNRFGIFRQAISHCENMSSIGNKKERMALIGAQQSVTAASLIGTEQVAVEDVGVLEGIQGDDAEEVLAQNVEDLINMKLSDNYDTIRGMYFFPDRVVRTVEGAATYIDGFYQAAAAAGYFSAKTNVAVPITNKVLTGFSIQRDRIYSQTMLNQLGSVGATVLQPVTGGGEVLAGRTLSQSGFIEDEEPSIVFIRDRVKQVLRQGLKPFTGNVEDVNTEASITSRAITLMNGLVSQGLITEFGNVRVERDKVDPRQWNVYIRFQPAYPINFVFIDLEVGVI